MYANKILMTGGIFHGMVYHKEALHNYLIPCHRKYIALHNQCSAPEICNSFKFLCSDWLLFSMAWCKRKYQNWCGVLSIVTEMP